MRRFSALQSQNTRQWRRAVDETLKPLGLTEATWLPLLHLGRADRPMLQKELAQQMTLDSSSVVRLLDGLEAGGLVERTTAEDRRAKALRLTEQGRRIVAQVEQVVDAARHRYLAQVTPEELTVALRVLEKVAAALAGEGGGAPSVASAGPAAIATAETSA
ncbi:MarR family transcriptional regulator [Xylophilus sp. Kf1]|nr:MarR family transcriptional regulator [Xylophilus sp. Kf1]